MQTIEVRVPDGAEVIIEVRPKPREEPKEAQPRFVRLINGEVVPEYWPEGVMCSHDL